MRLSYVKCLHTFLPLLISLIGVEAKALSQEEVTVLKEVSLLTVDSEAAKGPTYVKALLDETERKIVALKIYSYPKDVQEIEPSRFETGATLYQQNGKDVAILKSSNFDPIQGGSFELKYLYNGITNSYRSFSMNLVWDSDHWSLETGDSRRRFTHMNMIPRKSVGIVIGISKIEVD